MEGFTFTTRDLEAVDDCRKSQIEAQINSAASQLRFTLNNGETEDDLNKSCADMKTRIEGIYEGMKARLPLRAEIKKREDAMPF